MDTEQSINTGSYEIDIVQEHHRLVEAKSHRQKAEEETQLLSNRIALLKQEEVKTLKKIEETRNRAQEIMQIRLRNLELHKQKQDSKSQKQEQEQAIAMRLRLQNEKARETRAQTRQELLHRLKEEVSSIKDTKQENKALIEKQKTEILLKNTTAAQQVRNRQREAEEKRRVLEAERQAKMRAELERRILVEEELAHEREEELGHMEQEEMELIQKLQNSQLMQQTAYEELEEALNCPIDESMLSNVSTASFK